MAHPLINIGGQIHEDPSHARIPVLDRGFLYGDSLYEVARTYGGKLHRVEDHLTRLQSSAKLCKLTLGQDLSLYAQEMIRTVKTFLEKSGEKEAYCRLIVTRGEGKIGFPLKNLTTPTQFVIIVQALDPITPAVFERGMHLEISERLRNSPRALDPAMKSGNYLNSLLACLEANENQRDDALLCDGEGYITEGTTFNVFYIRRGIAATAPLDVGILDGITRRHVIQVAEKIGIPVRQVRFPSERLREADEIFITSTLKEVFPVTRLDGKPVSKGVPGPLTRKLAEEFHQWAIQNP